jgi:hypothetical protein
MKLPAGIDKWGSAALGVVSLLLVAKLVGQYRGMQPGNSHAHPAPASESPTHAGKGSSHATEDLAQYDPDVHFAALKVLDARPLPDEDRNPFEFVGGAAPPPPPAAVPPPQLPPAPPPPPPLKAMGYNELPGGKKEAMVTYNDDLQMVHEGDLIGTKYKVVTINPTMIVVEDGETHKTLELPFPQ